MAVTGGPLIAEVGNNESFASIKKAMESAYPSLELSYVEIEGGDVLRSGCGGMRVFWLFRGAGEVYLPEGYRTREGDGLPLSPIYVPEAVDPGFAERLEVIEKGIKSFSNEALPHVRLILERRRDGKTVGDIAAYLWALDQVERPWSKDRPVEDALEALFESHNRQGYWVKQSGSYERVEAGDQITLCGDEEVPVSGSFACMSIEKKDRNVRHVSTARRLRHLLDTAGGCSFDFQPVRRLPLTWHLDRAGRKGDGLNFVNSHVVNIPEELSSTHFHPRRPINGGLPQTEVYLVLDPAGFGIVNKDREAGIILFPDLEDLHKFEHHNLKPGDLVYIPPGVAHRGLDVFVNVLTLPGFKPHNEIYIDQEILDRTAGASPYNESGLQRKNYNRLDEIL